MDLEKKIKKQQQETQQNLDLNIKKIQLVEQEIKQIQTEAQEKILKLKQERTQIVSEVLKQQGALNNLNELLPTENKVESK